MSYRIRRKSRPERKSERSKTKLHGKNEAKEPTVPHYVPQHEKVCLTPKVDLEDLERTEGMWRVRSKSSKSTFGVKQTFSC